MCPSRPAGARRARCDVLALLLRQRRCASFPPLRAAKTPESDGGRVFSLFGRLLFDLASGKVDQQLSKLVRVVWAFA